jgi:hypothetical protein
MRRLVLPPVLTAALLTVAMRGAPAAAREDGRTLPPTPEALQHLAIEIGGEQRSIDSIELVGFETLSAPDVWGHLEAPVPPFDFAAAAGLIRALEGSESFATIDSRLVVAADGRLKLELRLREHPRVRAVVVRGLVEFPEPRLAAALLGSASDEPAQAKSPPAWLAATGPAGLRPGILRGGVAGAAQRALEALFAAGYRMASASGALTADGTLTVDVDEGLLGEVRLVGVPKRVRRSALQALQLPPSRTFLEGDLPEALRRVEKALPFLQSDWGPRLTRALPQVRTWIEPGAPIRFSLREAAPVESTGAFSVEGHALTLYFETRKAVRFFVSPDELIRHTPVGGVGFGAITNLRVWDPQGRVQLKLETFSATADSKALDPLGEDSELASTLRVHLPTLRIADLGLQAYSQIDSGDEWRLGRQSSYVNSLFFGRPDMEYYWRSGSALNITVQPLPTVIFDVEHRNDSYRSMPVLESPPVVFRPETPFHNPPIEEGELGSLILRLELTSEPVHPDQLRGLFRSPDRSIIARPQRSDLRSEFQFLASLELANHGLGSQEQFDFARFVGDGRLFLATGRDSGLGLRARVAGGSGLPPQREEALGGWSTLRGYDLKEFRGGDWSALAMAEYRHSWLAAFVDVGALHRPGAGWTGPHVGIGAKLHPSSLPGIGPWLRRRRFLPAFQIAAAWRLDDASSLGPSARILVGDVF